MYRIFTTQKNYRTNRTASFEEHHLQKNKQNKINIDKHKQATETREPIATATQTMLEKEDRCS